jgi:hypothetical protein
MPTPYPLCQSIFATGIFILFSWVEQVSFRPSNCGLNASRKRGGVGSKEIKAGPTPPPLRRHVTEK